jgi:hypothetical protein
MVVVAATGRRRASSEGKKHVSLSRRGLGHGPPLSHTKRTTHSSLSLAVEYGMINECHFTLSTPAFRYCHYCCYCCCLAINAIPPTPWDRVRSGGCSKELVLGIPRLVSDDDQVSMRITVHVPMRLEVVLIFRAASQA